MLCLLVAGRLTEGSRTDPPIESSQRTQSKEALGALRMICVAVSYVIKPGREDEAVGHLRALMGPPRREPGCRFYLAHRSPTDPRRFFLYEQYDDQAAIEAHRAAPYFIEHAVNGLFAIAESRTPEFYDPIATD